MLYRITLILAAALLLCLAPMPYGYYMFVRYAACIIFALLAFRSYNEKQAGQMVVFIALAILFQPFCKIALGRVMWNVVDVAVAIYLIFPWIKKHVEIKKTFPIFAAVK